MCVNVCALHVSAGQEILYEATETHKRSSAPDRVRAEEEEEEEQTEFPLWAGEHGLSWFLLTSQLR